MPSVKNPNGPGKVRLAAEAAKAKAQRQQRGAFARNKISKPDAARGARPGLLPNSGPNAKLSSKKQRKLEKKMGYALRRKMERDGEVIMADAVEETPKDDKKAKEVDMDDVQ